MSYLALYRQYRPQNFYEVLGQKHIVLTLQNALKSEKVAHAYLFCGPKGVGKTTMARILARAINCKNLKKNNNQKIEPCNQCSSCKEILEDRATDLIEIDAASNRGIDEIRDLREKIKFTPLRLDYKVFVIDEVHMLTVEAFNALLKTLEEPPSHAIFILATTEAHKIPVTILSRCQRFDFKKINQQELVKQLIEIARKEGVKIDKKSLNLIANNAGGSSRDALSLLNQVISLEDKEITIEETKSILGSVDLSLIFNFGDFLIAKDTKDALKLINQINDAGFDLKQFLKNLLEYFRKLLLIKIDSSFSFTENFDLTEEQLKKLKEQAKQVSSQDLVNYIKFFVKSKKEIDDSIIPQLPLEIAAIESTVNDVKDNLVVNEDLKKISDQVENNSVILKKEEIKTKKIDQNSKIFSSDKKKDKKEKFLDPNLISHIQGEWNNFIQEVSKNNFSLSTFLKVCDPVDIIKNKVILVCKYSFHQEKLKDLKNKRLIEDVACKFFNNTIIFDFILYHDLDSKLEKKIKDLENKKQEHNNTTEELASGALSVFGGEMI